jgi:hypothetical protein
MRPVPDANAAPPADNASVAAATPTNTFAGRADREFLAISCTIRARTRQVTLLDPIALLASSFSTERNTESR